MENNEVVQDQNPLATDSVGKLILKYSLPAIASSLVSSLYNIVDQIFVGQKWASWEMPPPTWHFPLL